MTTIIDARPEWLKKEMANPRCWVHEQNGQRCERGPVVATIPGIGYVCRYHYRGNLGASDKPSHKGTVMP